MKATGKSQGESKKITMEELHAQFPQGIRRDG
jgi:hypothetical protein